MTKRKFFDIEKPNKKMKKEDLLRIIEEQTKKFNKMMIETEKKQKEKEEAIVSQMIQMSDQKTLYQNCKVNINKTDLLFEYKRDLALKKNGYSYVRILENNKEYYYGYNHFNLLFSYNLQYKYKVFEFAIPLEKLYKWNVKKASHIAEIYMSFFEMIRQEYIIDTLTLYFERKGVEFSLVAKVFEYVSIDFSNRKKIEKKKV